MGATDNSDHFPFPGRVTSRKTVGEKKKRANVVFMKTQQTLLIEKFSAPNNSPAKKNMAVSYPSYDEKRSRYVPFNAGGEAMRKRLEDYWTRQDLEAVGIAWPPKKGWAAQLIADAAYEHEQLQQPSSSACCPLCEQPIPVVKESFIPEPDLFYMGKTLEQAIEYAKEQLREHPHNYPDDSIPYLMASHAWAFLQPHDWPFQKMIAVLLKCLPKRYERQKNIGSQAVSIVWHVISARSSLKK